MPHLEHRAELLFEKMHPYGLIISGARALAPLESFAAAVQMQRIGAKAFNRQPVSEPHAIQRANS